MVVIFDWDGTLHDSKYPVVLSWIETGKKFGVSLTEDKVLACTGLDLNGISDFLGFPDWHREEAIANAVKIFRKEIMKKDYLFPNTRKTLDELNTQHKIALYTNGTSWLINKLMEKYRLRDYFDVIVTSETSVKPSPDGIDIILNELGEKKGFMIDDAPEGILAAKQAGIPSIGAIYGMNPHRLRLASPDAVIRDVSEVPFVIKRF